MIFDSRQQAGRLLAQKLKRQQIKADVVYGLVRGGLPVAAEISRLFRVPLRPLVVKKIGAPGNPEFAVGTAAKVPGQPEIVTWWNQSTLSRLDLTDDWQQAQVKLKQEEIDHYLLKLKEIGLSDDCRASYRSIVIADDGTATGATMLAAVKAVRKGVSWSTDPKDPGGQIVVALPVASTEAARQLRQLADEVVILHEDRWLGAVGQFYRHFDQVGWEEVRELFQPTANSHQPDEL